MHLISATNPIVLFLWNASPCSLQLKLLHQLVISSWIIPVVLKACLRTSIGAPEIALGRERSPHSGPIYRSRS